MFKEHYGEANQDNVIEFLAYDDEYPNSIAGCLRAARENARSVRETITPEMWTQINSMYLHVQSNREIPEPEQMLDAFREVSKGCHMFQGIADATMSHNEAWNFLRLGRQLERADPLERLRPQRLQPGGLPGTDGQLGAAGHQGRQVAGRAAFDGHDVASATPGAAPATSASIPS